MQGMRNKEIAAHMGITERTVKFHVSNVYRKYSVSGRTKLVARLTGRNIVEAT